MCKAAQPELDTSEILFQEGIIGVPRARRFRLLQKSGSPIRLLQSLDIPGFALPVVDPTLANGDYQPALGARIPEALGIRDDDPVLILAVTALEKSGPVANLRAPLVINVARRLGIQVILDIHTYPLRAVVKTET